MSRINSSLSFAGALRHAVTTSLAVVLTALSFAAAAAVDANKAGEAELQSVKGVGPALSSKILSARQQGAFKDWPDLQMRVTGIGARNSAKLSQGGLTVNGAGYDAPPDAGVASARGTSGKARVRDVGLKN